MLLAIDIGNTRAKAAVFDGDDLVFATAFPDGFNPPSLLAILSRFPEVLDVVVSSVGETRLDFPIPYGKKLHVVGRTYAFPFDNLYRTPDTLGVDRMVLASGAVLAFPGMNRLVVDAGTCITYDFVDDADRYHGGAISPGIRMRYNAMHDYTAKLPLLEPEFPESFIGGTTAGSMHAGVIGGVLAEIEFFTAQYHGNRPNFITILTGGDTEFLAGHLKNSIFANQNFLLESLNKTFRQNH